MKKLAFYVSFMVVVLMFPAFVSADITMGLAEHWRFEQDNGTGSETSSNVGQIVGNSAWITGVDGQAILVLKKAYISVLDTLFPSGSAARTISIVVQLKADPNANNGEVVLSYGNTSGNGTSFILVQETNGFCINFNGHTWGTSARYSGWTHIVVVIPDNAVNTSNAMIYVNGKLIVASTLSGSVCPLNTVNSGHAYIGKDISSQNPEDYLDAGVDDLRIYNRALTTDDIQELYAIYRPVIEQRGEKGWSPNLAVEENLTLNKTVLKLKDWLGGEGQTPSIPGPYLGSNGFVSNIEDAVNIKGATGAPGTNGENGEDGQDGVPGINGLNGWSPVFGIETVSDKSVLKVTDWTGSSGAKPTSNVYVGATGFTNTASDAINIRGPQGPAGSGGTFMIENDIMLNVPTDYLTIQDALAYLDNKIIAGKKTVTIKVADATYTNYDTIIVDHPNGNRINIIGNTTTPSNCIINFMSGVSGLSVNNGNSLGLIDGFTFVGTKSGSGIGIDAGNNSLIKCGEHMIVKSFFHGVVARNCSTIYAPKINISDNVQYGAEALYTAIIDLRNSYVSKNGYGGVYSATGSTVIFSGGTTVGNANQGVLAYQNAFVYADSSISDGNAIGFHASINSCITVKGAVQRNNTTAYSPALNTEGNRGSFIYN